MRPAIFCFVVSALLLPACGGETVGDPVAAPEGGAGGAAPVTFGAPSPTGGTSAAGAPTVPDSMPIASAGAPPVVPSGHSFRRDVAPIFDRACALSGCHDGQSYVSLILGPSAHFDAEQVLSELVDGKTYLDTSRPFVKPGAPDDSVLVRKIEGDFAGLSCDGPAGCGGKMPPSAKPQLTTDEIATIRAWIAEGAADD